MSNATSPLKVAASKVVGTISADPLKFTPPIDLGVVRVAADPVVLWFRVGMRAAASVPDVILAAPKFGMRAAASVPVVIVVAFRVVSPEPSP